jgi:hypothetical protein
MGAGTNTVKTVLFLFMKGLGNGSGNGEDVSVVVNSVAGVGGLCPLLQEAQVALLSSPLVPSHSTLVFTPSHSTHL